MFERMRSKNGVVCGCLIAAAFVASFSAKAEDGPDTAPDADQNRAEYERVAKEITLSAERLSKLAADIATVKKDSASITAALIQSAKTEQKLGQDIEDISGKVGGLKEQEKKLRESLAARRDVLAEVLGALQRMGLNPPPAILVKPEDALSSVRSAILLGAVVPELRHRADIVVTELKELSRVTTSIEAERTRLAAAVTDQVAEKQRLNLLLQAKEKLQSETETALVDEQKKARDLAAKASSLKDLIASLDAEAEKTRKAAEKARQNEAAQADADAKAAATAVPEANRLASSVPFSAMQGQVSLPVTGKIRRRFGADDGTGGAMLGDMVATQSGAIVTAPADGSVLYAGPFRSYGQLLILNAGDGYHVVLAGMSKLNVAAGQAVLAGEPIGTMGEARVASTSATQNGNTTLELYIEFRKDGKPVDPNPWWAERFSGRT
ncbi:murein hydrolase activator EnvC [Mesorhizobium sp. 1M-11]|uniref:murein hydrolase activator EnvC family protein n=2 Tax=unclassified Mesorhizobium TaxID=325217 RepID=UPI0006C74752|nr:murein hydrolase activator EnvC [Mesorhizobium sp. 1M-11]